MYTPLLGVLGVPGALEGLWPVEHHRVAWLQSLLLDVLLHGLSGLGGRSLGVLACSQSTASR
jgi:hypothetical protein